MLVKLFIIDKAMLLMRLAICGLLLQESLALADILHDVVSTVSYAKLLLEWLVIYLSQILLSFKL